MVGIAGRPDPSGVVHAPLQIGDFMRKVFSILCFFALCASAQQYFQASGQTGVFTLTAGATAGPGSSAVRYVKRVASVAPHMLVTTQNGIRIGVTGIRGAGRIAIYNLEGRRVQSADFSGASMVAVRPDLGNGVYFARLEVNGRLVLTTRFWKAR
jgi:hypothetical protein